MNKNENRRKLGINEINFLIVKASALMALVFAIVSYIFEDNERVYSVFNILKQINLSIALISIIIYGLFIKNIREL